MTNTLILTAAIRNAVRGWTLDQLSDFVGACPRPTMLDSMGRFNARCIAVARAELMRRTVTL